MKSLIFGLTLGCLLPQVMAEEVLRLTDQTGQSVPGAVVEIIGVQPLASGWSETGYVMDQKDFQFSPRVLVVPVGASVEFPNSDDSRHHVYSFSNTRTFEIQLYAGNQAEPVTFSTPGVVAVGCNIHDRMSAHIYVSDEGWADVTDESGEVNLPALPDAGPAQIRVWHADMATMVTLPVSDLLSRDSPAVVELPFVLPEAAEADEPANSLRDRLKSFKQNDG